MKRALKILGIAVGVLVLVVLLAYAIGAALPRDHVISSATTINAGPTVVAQRIGDPAGFDNWRDTHTEIVAREPSAIRYREHAMGQAVDYRIVRSADGQQFRSTILSEDLPFGGSWAISVTPQGSGSRVTVVEHGFVRSPLWRFAAHYIFGQTMAIDGYLGELKASFETGPGG